MIIAKIASIRTPPTVCTHLPTRSPTTVIHTSAPITIAVVVEITQFCAMRGATPGPKM